LILFAAILKWRIDTIIRTATPGDCAVVADFNARIAWETEKRRLDPKRVLAGVAGLLNNASRGTYYIAEVNGEIAGQLLITYEWSDWRNGNFWWIQSVYVAETFRGNGIFRALYGHVQALAKQQPDVCGLRLYMESDNVRARKAYEQAGLRRTNYEVFEIDFVEPHDSAGSHSAPH
jgi:GNAT superfamily N-acetyltransferase